MAKLSVMYSFMPSTTETTAIRNVTPMKMPMTEKLLFIFCVQMTRSASRTASRNGMS